MIFTVFLFIRLISSFGIDQQSLACSQTGYSVYLTRFMEYVQNSMILWRTNGLMVKKKKKKKNPSNETKILKGTITKCRKLSITLK